MLSPWESVIGSLVATTLLALLTLGAVAAYAGGASVVKGAARVAFWGAMAMALTAIAGYLFDGTI